MSEQERITKNESAEVMKKSGSTKFWQSIFTFDGPAIKDMLINKILIPGTKNLMSNLFKTAIDSIFGTGTSAGYSSGSTNTASYQAYYNDRGTVPKTQRKISNPLEEDIWVREEAKARDLVTDIKMTIVHNGFATVGQLYDRAGLTVPYTAEYWGWMNFDAKVLPGRNAAGEDGWVIVTPPAMEIRRN